ncbi:MAG: 1-deoxy-D-xylulose-5-phosphate synthase [Phycisphaerales bacterium]
MRRASVEHASERPKDGPTTMPTPAPLLPTIKSPADLKALPVERLPDLAAEMRRAICDQVSRSGGHLAPNLGVVELTIALHYVFDFSPTPSVGPNIGPGAKGGGDRLLFDVGHQCYPHKLLTGRQPLLAGLRTRQGMSGFPEPNESAYDLFRVGHAGTGISTAVGMARGDTLRGEGFHSKSNASGRRVVTMIGDASIVNGVAMEGLNNAGTLKRQFLVILNDNGMSISKPQGAVSQYFDRLRLSHIYGDFKAGAKKVLSHLPGGSLISEAYHLAGEGTKAMIAEGAWFEHFGLLTVGPIDGHDFGTLIEFLAEARDFDRPMVLHVKTVKGKGYAFAEKDASKFHSPPAFTNPDTSVGDGEGGNDDALAPSGLVAEGCRVELKSEGRSFTAAFGEAMHEMMAGDERVVACTAAMPDGTGLTKVLSDFPDRAWDTGICESHALDMMAGLAKTGFKPFFAVYSTFLQRAFDQAFQEAALQGLPVRLCLDRAGLVGGDGSVHHGFCDVSLLRTLPGACLMAAIDEPSLRAALELMRTFEDGLSAVRYPRDVVSPRLTTEACPAFELGKARCLTPGDEWLLRAKAGPRETRADDAGVLPDAAVLAFGTPAITALEAAQELAGDPSKSNEGSFRVAVFDARFAKPLDTALLKALLSRRIPIVTVEDHSIVGGFGSAVLEAAQEMGLDASGITRLGLPDAWVYQDSRSKQLAEVGLDRAGLIRAIRNAAQQRDAASARPHGAQVARKVST